MFSLGLLRDPYSPLLLIVLAWINSTVTESAEVYSERTNTCKEKNTLRRISNPVGDERNDIIIIYNNSVVSTNMYVIYIYIYILYLSTELFLLDLIKCIKVFLLYTPDQVYWIFIKQVLCD